MRNPNVLVQIIATGLLVTWAVGQAATLKSPVRDQQAVSIVTRAVNTSGGPAIDSLRDFKASGEITYYLAGEEVKGDASILGKGTKQFRLDASLPEGLRSLIVNNGAGSIRQPNGKREPMEGHNTIHAGSVTLPVLHLAAGLQDDTTSVLYIGQETKEGRDVHHIRLQRIFVNDVQKLRSRLTRRDFFIDATTFEVVATIDMLHPKYQSGLDYPHEMQFSDYRKVDGILVPFSITELISGQRTFALQVSEFKSLFPASLFALHSTSRNSSLPRCSLNIHCSSGNCRVRRSPLILNDL